MNVMNIYLTQNTVHILLQIKVWSDCLHIYDDFLIMIVNFFSVKSNICVTLFSAMQQLA